MEHGVDGLLIRPSDDRSLRAAASMPVRDGALRRRMGEAGRRAVLGRSWEVVCGELLRHYERVILNAVVEAGSGVVQPVAGSRAYS